jgi:DNA polymerase elongation subunit (family B)
MVEIGVLRQLLKDKNVDGLKKFIENNELEIRNGKIYAKNQNVIIDQEKYFDRRQMVQKILQNSGFGGLVNPGSRFNDKRVGQSITLNGKITCKHMNSFVNECITGKYEIEGDAIIAIDTDSSQFSAWPIMKPLVDAGGAEWSREIAVGLYTAIGDKVNESFPNFMKESFNCPDEYGKLIRGSCESVGSKALYITKKRYAILNYWKDGKYLSEPKLKAMGLDLRRSDTPVICQKFLKTILMEFLQDGDDSKIESRIIQMINEFKTKFKLLPLHEQGTPKRVNNLTHYAELINKGKGNRVPGHVRAAINWNLLKEINNDTVHTRIVDGMKCVVCPMKDNSMKMTSIAYPIDEIHLPTWFTSLPFDNDSMIASVVDKKIENLFSRLPNWKAIESATRKVNTFADFFS